MILKHNTIQGSLIMKATFISCTLFSTKALAVRLESEKDALKKENT